MIDAVARENGDRALDRKPAIDQRLRDSARRLLRRAVCDHAPMSLALPLGEKDSRRRYLRPMVEPVGHHVGMGAERAGRSDDQRAVGAPLDRHCRRAEGQLHPCHFLLPMIAVVSAADSARNYLARVPALTGKSKIFPADMSLLSRVPLPDSRRRSSSRRLNLAAEPWPHASPGNLSAVVWPLD